ncbi:sugar ABC transporter ATP-binding protein [Granulicella sp. dw_53]|uniref:sugar ABC transporter ATP-binding protein n=1 Tax=Granulicella sp. dw_53 TaxID=2719792 RepID=UPI0021021447|nr:sugar ABC transporter ATP-binding protein [Granulicella sp. dw_53]
MPLQADSRLRENPPPRALLTASSITKNFAGVRALKSASLQLLQGEVHALIGENGAGKSTLTKIITGAISADSGTLEIAGKIVPHNDPNIARSLGIAAIYQQPSLFPHLTVAENIALALEGESSSRRVNWKQRRAQATDLLSSVGSSLDPMRLAATLSMAEQQIVEIAKAIGANASILLMDEPTALLTGREVDNLFSLIYRLRHDGVGILYISHRLEEISAIADRITVMRDGETIACRNAADVTRSELIYLMVGRSVASIFPKRSVPIGDLAIEVRSLHNPSAGLHDISFSVRSGEIFGLAGLVGSGRTELARTLFGLTPSTSSIEVRGESCHIHSPAEAIARGIAYVPEDRRQHGIILEMGIDTNISLANLSSVSQYGLITPDKEATLATHHTDSLRIKTSSIYAAAGTLSGGNQQKVALARWLAIHPQIMILDEPTQGVDVGSKAEIHELIMQLAERGVAIILISSELPEILAMSDRIAVLHAGTITGILSRGEATQPRIMSLAFGHTYHDTMAEHPQ